MNNAPQFMASGAVYVSSFVKMDSTTPAPYQVLQCAGPQDLPVGISQQGSFNAPGVFATLSSYATNINTVPTASAPNEINVFGIGEVCRLQLSPACASVNPGDPLCSDTSGFGIDINNPNISGNELRYVGAIALTSGSANQFIRVLVVAPMRWSASNAIRFSATPALVAPFTTSDQTFTVAGLPGSTQAAVSVTGEALTGGLVIGNAKVLAAGSLQIRFANVTTASIAPAVQFFDCCVLG